VDFSEIDPSQNAEADGNNPSILALAGYSDMAAAKVETW